jgi:hypothetical protein
MAVTDPEKTIVQVHSVLLECLAHKPRLLLSLSSAHDLPPSAKFHPRLPPRSTVDVSTPTNRRPNLRPHLQNINRADAQQLFSLRPSARLDRQLLGCENYTDTVVSYPSHGVNSENAAYDIPRRSWADAQIRNPKALDSENFQVVVDACELI